MLLCGPWSPIILCLGIVRKSVPLLELGFPQSVFAENLYREIALGKIDAVPEFVKVSDEASRPEITLANSAQY